jgi:hypothetical protein
MMKRFIVRFCACLFLQGAALSLLSLPTAAQQPSQSAQPQSQAQIVDAIRQACPGDYQTYCRTVPTGGPEALNCLQQNMSRLTAGCHQALSALNSSAAAGGAATPPSGQR